VLLQTLSKLLWQWGVYVKDVTCDPRGAVSARKVTVQMRNKRERGERERGDLALKDYAVKIFQITA